MNLSFYSVHIHNRAKHLMLQNNNHKCKSRGQKEVSKGLQNYENVTMFLIICYIFKNFYKK